MKIANIVYADELVNHTPVDYINYYKESIEYDKLNKLLPTLYVGWTFMKSCNPDNDIIKNADVLKKRIISNELYWECSFTENKSLHIRGVESFISLIPQYYFIPKYSYYNLDPVFFQIKDVQDLMDVLPKIVDKLYCYRNEMLYVLIENKIWGINLKIYEYFQFNISEILTKIEERTTWSQNDVDGEIYMKYYKILPDFTQLKRYIITLL